MRLIYKCTKIIVKTSPAYVVTLFISIRQHNIVYRLSVVVIGYIMAYFMTSQCLTWISLNINARKIKQSAMDLKFYAI
jgi:hypothetical protein